MKATTEKPNGSHSSKSSGSTKKANSQNSGGDQSSQLRKLFEEELKDIYWAEKALTKAIPKMIKQATSEDLINALENHLQETENQVTRAEQVFNSLGMEPKAKKCDAMAGLIKEAEEIMEECEDGVMRDAGIISAAQKVEHYEIATYGTLRQFAETLGFDEAVSLLESTLEEEKAADGKLSEVAEGAINIEAAETPTE
ncbi:MAG TPA: ferritin-like domain-containing protein [Cyclobacteriaceae bacterium]|nr:ferritin-like domain-containing protein [Cyclobacteriaceae bacterium]